MSFEEFDLDDLRRAKVLLENPGIAARAANFIGIPIETGFKMLPSNLNKKVGEVVQRALVTSSNTAIFTLKNSPNKEASTIWHKITVATTGGVGGLFGLSALAVELPISTTIMLRSIADIARSEGEPIKNIESKIACIEVFAFGGPSKSDDDAEYGYFGVRTALAQSTSKAIEFITEKGFVEEGAPILVKLLAKIADRYSIQVAEKMAMQAIPLIGAVGGAIINTLFIDHYQDMARGHFIVRRLERKYGEEKVKEMYELL